MRSMRFESCSDCIMAELRHMEFQADAERNRLSRQADRPAFNVGRWSVARRRLQDIVAMLGAPLRGQPAAAGHRYRPARPA